MKRRRHKPGLRASIWAVVRAYTVPMAIGLALWGLLLMGIIWVINIRVEGW